MRSCINLAHWAGAAARGVAWPWAKTAHKQMETTRWKTRCVGPARMGREEPYSNCYQSQGASSQYQQTREVGRRNVESAALRGTAESWLGFD